MGIGTHTLIQRYKESAVQKVWAVDGFDGSVTYSAEGCYFVYYCSYGGR